MVFIQIKDACPECGGKIFVTKNDDDLITEGGCSHDIMKQIAFAHAAYLSREIPARKKVKASE